MAKIKELKRKASVIKDSTETPKEIVKVPLEEPESDSENEDLLTNINENEVDSSDTEGEIESSDEEILSFESADEDEDDLVENNSDEDIDDEEEDESELEFEESSEENDESDSDNEQNLKKEKINLKTPKVEVKQEATNGEAKNNDTDPKNSEDIEKIILQNKLDEYRDDTSDEEDIRNTVGNIPMHWYDEYKHIGYDWDAKKIIKPEKGDQLDSFLKRMEDPNFWRTVKDPQTGQNVILSEEDIEIIKRINSQRNPDKTFNEYAPWIEWFSSQVEQMPVRNIPAHKRSFLPSKSEKKIVSKLVHSIKMGWMKTTEELEKEKAQRGPKFYMLWETDNEREQIRRIHDHVSAPKRDLPGHAESYNPPKEYLFDKKEMREWKKYENEPHKRKLHFMPQKFNSLREVPAYPRYLRERFLRCLDLYLCPRAKRMKLTIQADYLIPKLPSPRDLQPYPTIQSLIYKGHTDIIRTISIEPKGEYIVTGSDDTTIKIWEIVTARCIKTIMTNDVVRSVAWCPNPKLSLIAVASGKRLLLINPKVGDKMLIKKSDEILNEMPKNDIIDNDRIRTAVQWNLCDSNEYEVGIRIIINHFKEIKQVTWHGRGDYLSAVMPEGTNRSVIIHQLSKRRSQIPFSKSKGLIQCVLFHPIKPCIFVATQRNIRIYDLVKQELLKKLLTNCKWISNMSIHPKGDNLLVSTYDKKILWFDLDLSTKPYQTMRLHFSAVRSVAYHLRYPLFASASDDRSVIVSHGMVYNDLLQNPLIVPLKRLHGHDERDDFGVFDVVWHPTQPWLFSTGADCTARLYS